MPRRNSCRPRANCISGAERVPDAELPQELEGEGIAPPIERRSKTSELPLREGQGRAPARYSPARR